MFAKHRLPCLAAIVLCHAVAISAQIPNNTPAEAAHRYTAAHRPELQQQFSDFLTIPNVAADPAGLERNADLLVAQLKQRGVEAQLLTLTGSPSVVYGKLDTPGATHTIVFYAHYDGNRLRLRNGRSRRRSSP